MLANITINIDGEELTPELEQAIEQLEEDVEDIVVSFQTDYPEIVIEMESN